MFPFGFGGGGFFGTFGLFFIINLVIKLLTGQLDLSTL